MFMQKFKSQVEMTLNVKFKKLHEDAVLPKYAKAGDAGMDCVSVTEAKDKGDYLAYDLGIAVEIPEGFVGLLFPRSSNSKKDLLLANSVGVVDSGYRGPIQARFKKVLDHPVKVYKKGDKVCQLIVMPYPQITAEWADELSDTERGDGAFGHTGE